MPNYIFKCIRCHYRISVFRSISSDPSEKLWCPECNNSIEKTMTRRIGKPKIGKISNKVYAGDWYKKEYGHELGEGSLQKAQQQEDMKILEKEFRKRTGQ